MDHWLSTVFVDLVTPFHQGALDGAALASLVRWQASRGIRGFVVNGAAGEFASLSEEERRAVVAIVRSNAGRFAQLMLSAGSPDTAATVKEVAQAQTLGLDGILLRTPYYSRPTQAGLVAHARAVSAAGSVPIILDDDPDRCGVQLSLASLEALSACDGIVGVLDRRGDPRRCEALSLSMPGRFQLLTGQIDSFASYRLCGGSGAVSSSAALFPGLCVRLLEALRQNDYPTAQMLQRRAHPLLALLGSHPSPAQLKLALALLRPGSLSIAGRDIAADFETRWADQIGKALETLPREGGTVNRRPAGPSIEADPRLFLQAERQAAMQARI